MGLFEELREKFNQAADYTVKVTTDVTNQAKIRVDLHTQNVLLTRCYENLGRACYDHIKNSAENEAIIADYVAEADRLEKELCALREKLAALMGNSICPVCGKDVDETFPFCPHCGAKMPEKPVEPEETEDVEEAEDVEIEEEVEEDVTEDKADETDDKDGNGPIDN